MENKNMTTEEMMVDICDKIRRRIDALRAFKITERNDGFSCKRRIR